MTVAADIVSARVYYCERIALYSICGHTASCAHGLGAPLLLNKLLLNKLLEENQHCA